MGGRRGDSGQRGNSGQRGSAQSRLHWLSSCACCMQAQLSRAPRLVQGSSTPARNCSLTSFAGRGEAAGAVLAVTAHERQHSVAAGQALLSVGHVLGQAWKGGRAGKGGCERSWCYCKGRCAHAQAAARLPTLDCYRPVGALAHAVSSLNWAPGGTHRCTRGTWGSCRTSSWGRACSRG